MNGKTANAVNSISGTVSNGNLKIAVNGVESGDIPLPDSELPIITMDEEINVLEIDITSTNIVNDNNAIGYEAIRHTRTTVDSYRAYISGEKSLSRIFNDWTTSITQISYIDTISSLQGVREDFTITLPSSFACGLSDGQYKMPIDSLSQAQGMSTIRKNDNEPSDSEFMLFTVSNHVATVTTKTITLPHDKFACQGNYTPTRLFIIHDRILKIN